MQRLPSAIVRGLSLCTVLVISIFLGIAAYGKFFYPVEQLKQLDLVVSGFELLLIGLLFLFHMRRSMWLIASSIFASWAGYSTYWSGLKLSCSCLGSMIELTSGYFLTLDILFFVLSLGIAFLLRVSGKALYLVLLGSFFFALCGYVFAEWVFYEKIVKVAWSFIE